MENLFLKLFENTSLFEVGLIIILGLVFYFRLKNNFNDQITQVRLENKELRQETKSEFQLFREEMKSLREETRSEIQSLREETRAESQLLREEMKSEFSKVYQEIKNINQRIDKLYDTIIDLYRNLSNRDAA